jgi:DNA processing protein
MYPSLANDSLVDILRLIRTPNVGPVTFFQLMMRYGTAAEALAALPNLSIRGGRKQAIKPYSESAAKQEIEQTLAYDARFVRYGEADYPALLTQVSDAPPLLCIKGNAGSYRDHPLVAMVGSRNASANSCQFAQKLAREVGAAGIRVVSGLARGIDSYAHKGALATGTIGVIAGGIDNIYPSENAALYNEILENGAIISEQPFGQIPFAGAFPSRNRIIAGMSNATLVVEASPKSGSLITARLALEYDRELMAVPGSPLDPRAKGCNQLIKQGAHVAEEANDIIQIVKASTLQLSLRETAPSDYMAAKINDAEVARAHAALLEKLGPSAVSIDELVEQCSITAATIQAALLELELAGKIRRVVGGKVALIFSDDEQDVA